MIQIVLPHMSGCKTGGGTEDERDDREAVLWSQLDLITTPVKNVASAMPKLSKHGGLGLQDGLCSKVPGKLGRILGAVTAR